jgi:adenylate cyclase
MRIKLFGKLALAAKNGNPITVSGSKTQGLIAFLAMNMDMPPTRDRIMTLFWGDRFTDQARQSLRQAVSKLRRLAAEHDDDFLCADDDRIGFDPKSVSVDVDEFFRLSEDQNPQSALHAVQIMNGILLDGVYGQHEEFEDWLATERQRVVSTGSKLLEKVANHQAQNGDIASALGTARKLISLDHLRDGSQMLLIRLLAQSGERATAIQQYKSYEETLRRELDVGAGPDLQKLFGEITAEKFSSVHQTPDEPTVSDVAPKPAIQHLVSRPVIALAPFSSVVPGPDQQFFVDTITPDIMMNLSRYKWLDVHASAEASGPRLTPDELSALHRDHGIEYVVHGTLRTLGNKLRLTVQLVEAKTGRYLWVHRYDRVSDDFFDIQDEISNTIAASVEAELQRYIGRASHAVPFSEMTAWDCYHRGLAIQYEFSAETNADAQRHFHRAVELDPNFAAAYARLSYAMVISAIYFDAEDVTVLLSKALDYARTAARLDPDDAVARFALGRVYLAQGDYDRSLAELGSAIELNPGMAQAHCGLGDSLAYSGDLDGAMICFEEAVRISPTDPYRWAFLSYGATALLFKQEFEAAVEWASQAESVPNSHFWPTAIKASALGHLGRDEQARQALKELRTHKPDMTTDYVRERLFYLRDQKQIEIYIDGLSKAGLT